MQGPETEESFGWNNDFESCQHIDTSYVFGCNCPGRECESILFCILKEETTQGRGTLSSTLDRPKLPPAIGGNKIQTKVHNGCKD